MAEIDRLESAIARLTDISIDLKAMIAAHESRLNQSEKDTGVIFKLLEDRRKETDTKVDEIYTHMNDKDDKILLELKAHREASAKEHEMLSKRINSIEKYIWIAIGGATVISAIIPYVMKMMFH
jgi:hypothetical protein